jgi:hypothetical protein
MILGHTSQDKGRQRFGVSAGAPNLRGREFWRKEQVWVTKRNEQRGGRQGRSERTPHPPPSRSLVTHPDLSFFHSCLVCECPCVMSGCAWHVFSHHPTHHHSFLSRVGLSCTNNTTNKDEDRTLSRTTTREKQNSLTGYLSKNLGLFV